MNGRSSKKASPPAATLKVTPTTIVQSVTVVFWVGVGLCFHSFNCWGEIGLSNLELNKLQDTLVSRYHFHEEAASASLEDVKRILEHPPEIEDVIYARHLGAGLGSKEDPMNLKFGETDYWRSAWGQNGFVLSFGRSALEATNMVYRGSIKGRFGITNWRGSDALPHYGGVVYSDGISEGENIFGLARVNVDNATSALKLGVFVLAIGSVRFTDATHFTAANTMDWETNLDGTLILSQSQRVTGIAFTWQNTNAEGSIWIASFLKTPKDGHESSESSASEIQFPARKFATCRFAPEYTNFIQDTLISSIKLSTDTLPVDYFRPTNWISDQPLAQSLVISNAMYDRLNGKFVLASSVGHHDRSRYRLLIIVILVLGLVVPLAIMLRGTKRGVQISTK